MTYTHVPVMLPEVLTYLNPCAGKIYLDCTLGGGGHSESIARAMQPGGRLYGIDRDADAIGAASARLAPYSGFTAVRGNFHDARALMQAYGESAFDGILADLGVSSFQLDSAPRGFSYHENAPLDMRMDASRGETAADYVNAASPEDITRVLRDYGEEKWAARIAAIISEKRREHPIVTTQDLVACVDAAIPKAVRRRDEGHPARRTFQALRIQVNDELAPLEAALRDLCGMLSPGGRLAVITFHSLEDRIVKNTFRSLERPCICPPKAPICTCGRVSLGRVLGGGAIKPGESEITINPRARSAKLRVFERG